MFTKQFWISLGRRFWRDAGERAARTFAQALVVALALPPAAAAVGFDVRTVDWPTALSFAAGAALLSLLMSIGGTKRGDPQSASLLSAPKQEG